MNAYERLRQHAIATGDPPHVLARVLADLLGTDLTQKVVVAGFRRAFPSIPLPVALQVAAWHRVGAGDMSDAEFDALLAERIKSDLSGE